MKVLSGREPTMKRAYAADALGEIGDGRAVELLLMAIKDGNDDLVREHSVTALGKICDPRAVEPLIELLKSDDYFFIRKRAAYTLYVFLKRKGLSEELRQKIMSHWRSWYLT